ncbi:uncharacterized protein Z519_05005 [Cladophialophora bantiana CBS 173.52]|uniref:Cytochrome b561 domain-containing protein n=1 Tax=Cladophialophora bantiana (strain ATCC 10958 / CBS 173.52 / CDC B-1940 / NIH 8579) TaxID=1442370 RepID=A0A0D2EUZ8_CLAB1|nr:uncharacterized protein Z519_05005 [Cladophialophora bantiana CBS 173.52]KIW93691.1 hypothetical protein Z519_05005 [Cladophialophora bantiana CBS 173.52]
MTLNKLSSTFPLLSSISGASSLSFARQDPLMACCETESQPGRHVDMKWTANLTLAQFVPASPPTATVPVISASSPWLTTSTPTTNAAYHAGAAGWSTGASKRKFPAYFGEAKIAHAALGAAAFLLCFPLGGIIVKVWPHRRIVWIHAAIQGFALAVFVASTGLGIWMGLKINALGHYHCVIGLVILGLLVLQPLMKLHWFHKKIPKVVHFVHIHLWLGRALIVLGIVDGGLGFQFADTFKAPKWANGWKIAYGVCGALVWIIYVSVVIVWVELKKLDSTMSVVAGNGEMAALTEARGRAEDRQKMATRTVHDVEIGEIARVEPMRPTLPGAL